MQASRDRVRAAVHFEEPDRLPCDESFWDGTIAAWRKQGMPATVSPQDYFALDICSMSLDASPRFQQKVLDRSEGYIIFEDRFGYTAKRLEDQSSTIHYLKHVNTGREAWEWIKPRFTLSDDPREPARIDDASYFMHFGPYPSWQDAVQKYHRLYATDRYMLFLAYGPWEQMWRHRSMPELLVNLATDPEWVAEMAVTYQELVLSILERCFELGMTPDGFFLIEDLGSNKATLMSPATWRRLFKPHLANLGAFLQGRGIDFWMHSCGNVLAIIDDLVECGVNVLDPLQVSAGIDANDLRHRYGRRLALHGNISVQGLLGPREQLREELRRKIPGARGGGYIFHSDHSVPPQVSFEQYSWAIDAARSIFQGEAPP
jgi:uroporphyrinogen decarboxylase